MSTSEKGKKVHPGLFNLELLNKPMKQTLWQWASPGDIAVGLLCSYPAPYDIHDTPLAETDTGETNLLSDQVWQFLHKAVRPDCFAWALGTQGANTNFIHFLRSHFQPGEDENLLSISGVKLRERLNSSAEEPAQCFPVSCPGKIFSFSSSPAQKQNQLISWLPTHCSQNLAGNSL